MTKHAQTNCWKNMFCFGDSNGSDYGQVSETVPTGPEKCGRLTKQGARVKNWKNRVFVMRHNQLYYLKSINSTKRQGQVPLDGNWSVACCHIAGRNFPFVIQNPYGGRSFYCDAEDDKTRQEWVEAIKKTIACLGGEGVFDKESKIDPTPNIPDDKQAVGLQDFELRAVLGKGSFGKVMLVVKKDSGELFAMKVLRKEAIIAGNQVQHIQAERNILQEIQHPFTVGLHYAFQTKGKLYLLLDYVRGGELFYQLKKEGLFSEDRVRLYAAEIVLTLEHLHSKNIVYRDLKPENILLDTKGHVVVTDFGLSKEAVTSKQAARTFCGTPEYLAPEILKGVGHGKAVDWWSLGTLMYEMLTGLPPFYSQNRKVMFDKILKADLTFPSFVGREARDLLGGLLSRDPDLRLGCGATDATEIKAHPFFHSIDWRKVYNKEYQPVFVPEVNNAFDTSNFDPTYTTMPARDSDVTSSEIREAVQHAHHFVGFSFQTNGDTELHDQNDSDDSTHTYSN